MSNRTQLPPGEVIYTAVKLHTDGNKYNVLFLAQDDESAANTVQLLGLQDWGRLSRCGEMTPDGPMTTWDEDNEEKETP
jgi:hypothetical protein